MRFVVVGIGVEPAVELLEGSGIHLDNGVVVDEYCQTNVTGVYAAGDVANHYHPIFNRHIRVEHWQNAIKQGAAAARNMLGERVAYDEVHWFWSDQFDGNLQYAGFHTKWQQLVVRGRLDSSSYLACYVNDGRIDAAVGLNRAKDVRRVMPSSSQGAQWIAGSFGTRASTCAHYTRTRSVQVTQGDLTLPRPHIRDIGS